ncbi:MAG: hypothetical protein ACREQ5_08030 [Candidatus Dormibacteria bacterium]
MARLVTQALLVILAMLGLLGQEVLGGMLEMEALLVILAMLGLLVM